MGKIENHWQDRDYVLKWFGKQEGEARTTYRSYVKYVIIGGHRPELVGGGLILSQGGLVSGQGNAPLRRT